LKYRYQHSGKADVEATYKKFSTGMSVRANSFMKSVDGLFESSYFFPGMKEYRLAHDKGDYFLDYRIGYQLNKTAKVSLLVNNVFNREVMVRPADLAPPRVFAFQLVIKV
jgi:iron complex outermembrane receptor protein